MRNYAIQQRRKRQLKRHNEFKCFYCHIPLRDPRPGENGPTPNERSLTGVGFATVDHLVPLDQGGSNKLHNFVLCCWECNQQKANMSWQYFYKIKANARRHRGVPKQS